MIHFELAGKLIVHFLWIIIKHFLIIFTTEALIRRNPP